jgi:hypothetical protein
MILGSYPALVRIPGIFKNRNTKRSGSNLFPAIVLNVNRKITGVFPVLRFEEGFKMNHFGKKI